MTTEKVKRVIFPPSFIIEDKRKNIYDWKGVDDIVQRINEWIVKNSTSHNIRVMSVTEKEGDVSLFDTDKRKYKYDTYPYFIVWIAYSRREKAHGTDKNKPLPITEAISTLSIISDDEGSIAGGDDHSDDE